MAKLKSKKIESKFRVSARVYGFNGVTSTLVRVPVVVTTIPEVPEIIFNKKWAAMLISTNPLTYRVAISAKAEEF